MAAPLRLGLVGAGRWGRNYIRTLGELPQARLTRIASSNPETAERAPRGCAVFADWREMLDPAELDGVIIATPPRLHAEMASRALAAGIPVLVEKPLTLDVAEARSLRAQALERGVLVMVGHTHLFHPAYRALKALQPRYGPIVRMHGRAGNMGPYRPDVPVLWDWGAHDVAMCLDLTGTLPRCEASSALEERLAGGALGETVEVELAFPGGAKASLQWSNVVPKCRRFEVACENGSLVFDDLAGEKLVVADAHGARPVPLTEISPLNVVLSEFAAAIAARSRDRAGLELGVKVVEVLADCAQVAHLRVRAGSP